MHLMKLVLAAWLVVSDSAAVTSCDSLIRAKLIIQSNFEFLEKRVWFHTVSISTDCHFSLCLSLSVMTEIS